MGSFELMSQNKLKSVGVTLYEFEHSSTGARHFHLENSDENNAFMVAFPTKPTDSTGVAHILEHTALIISLFHRKFYFTSIESNNFYSYFIAFFYNISNFTYSFICKF